MGKNKWYFESENSAKQSGSANTQNRSKRSGHLPGTYVWESPENMPLPRLMQLIWQRLRRSWVALRFQTNRYSFGLLRPKTILKVTALAGLGYLAFDPDLESGFFANSNGNAIKVSRETNLEVAEEYARPKKTKKAAKAHTEPKAVKAKPKSDTAPVSSRQLLRQQSLDYIEQFHKVAIQEMKRYGIPASISLAQGLIESRAGTSSLAVANNNHFGMKCFSKNCKKGHCTNFTDDTHKDFFKKFANAKDGWRAHSELLASGRYARLKKYGRDYRSWARGLKAAGYATDPSYASKLIGIIERYDLHQYDRY
ncbi:MAG TPA: glucosaminidase domain-containing protein [Saprospiraceae bacterium]|nr:glucosaminidase domain-containing protein [Saprospiraceae bacterium]